LAKARRRLETKVQAARRRQKEYKARLKAAQAPKPPPPLVIKTVVKKPRVDQKVSPELVIGMQAAGVNQAEIARALDVTKGAVWQSLQNTPGARERMQELRDKLKHEKLERSHKVSGKVWDRLETEVDDGAAKDVDAITRSLLALEKIEAAASGEAHASGPAPAPVTNLDLKALVQVLIGPP
jgi:predicted transcriptional regulator